MPVLAIFTARITKAPYDMLRDEIDWENKHPAGAVFHAASFDEDGQIHVADVWESAEQLNALAQTQLVPTFAKHNIAPPSVVVYPTHRVIAYQTVRQFDV